MPQLSAQTEQVTPESGYSDCCGRRASGGHRGRAGSAGCADSGRTADGRLAGARPPSRRFVRVFDAPAPAAAQLQHHASEPSAVERLLGAEQLTVLRARHAEILARISVRGGDPARLEALREQAAAVDPDGWVTEADVTAGLASSMAPWPNSIGSSVGGVAVADVAAETRRPVHGGRRPAMQSARVRAGRCRRRSRRRKTTPRPRRRVGRPVASGVRQTCGRAGPSWVTRARYTFVMRMFVSRSVWLLSALALATATLAAQAPAGQAPPPSRRRRQSRGSATDIPSRSSIWSRPT